MKDGKGIELFWSVPLDTTAAGLTAAEAERRIRIYGPNLLKRSGRTNTLTLLAAHTVGFLGNGISDASALHASGAGISVNSTVDVAKEAVAVVLLEKDLSMLRPKDF